MQTVNYLKKEEHHFETFNLRGTTLEKQTSTTTWQEEG